MFKSTFIIFALFSTSIFAAPILDGLGGGGGGGSGGAGTGAAIDPLSSLPTGDLLGGSGSGLLSSLNIGNLLNTLKATDLIHTDKTLKLLRIQIDIGIPLASKSENDDGKNPLENLPTGLPPLPTILPLPTGLPIPSGNPLNNLPIPSIPGPSNPLGGILGRK